MSEQFDVLIVGAGIVGLAHATLLNRQGLKVGVIERTPEAVGASIRNFGMVWPVGQPIGEARNLALRSRELWLEVLQAAQIWHERCGSLHLAYHDDELQVLSEFAAKLPDEDARIISPDEVRTISPHVRAEGLRGAMWSPTEACVNPRTVVSSLPNHLHRLGVEFHFGQAVTHVEPGCVWVGGRTLYAKEILLCTGDEMSALFPGHLSGLGLVKTKLQMMKARPKDPSFRIGAHLCAGLTLGHYRNFRDCPSLPALEARFQTDFPEHVRWGVHLLVSQHEDGSLTIGDSHEYGPNPDPFLRQEIDQLILSYLNTFLPIDAFEVTERWWGVYAKHPSEIVIRTSPQPGVTAVTGVGGAGMTLSFGVAEQTVQSLITA